HRAHSLAAVARALGGGERTDVLRETLAAVRQIADGYWRAAAVGQLAGDLPEQLQPEAVSIAESVEDPYWRAVALHLLHETTGRLRGPTRQRADAADTGFSEPEVGAAQVLERAEHRDRAVRRLLYHDGGPATDGAIAA